MPVLVKDIMSKPVVTIDLDKSIKDAGSLLSKTKKGSLIVTKGGKPVGIITADDLVTKIISKNVKPSSVKVKDMMSKPLVTISPAESVTEASRKLKRSRIKRLPVVDDGKIVGIVSITDIALTSPEMVDILEVRLSMKEEPFEIKEEFTSGICDSCANYFDKLQNINDQWLCESCMDELEE